jgi:gluconate 2-dehydrogenase gamma chain
METRRQVLQGLIFSLGGAAALSAFDKAQAAAPIAAPKTAKGFYTKGELQTLTFLADAIIPRTDTPGALDAGVPAYMDHLYATWASEATKAEHRAHMAAIIGHLDRLTNVQSIEAGKREVQRRKALEALDAAAFGAEWSTHGPYRAVKSLIATIYYLSEPGATQELQYEPVPGHWIASAPLAEIGRTWAL